MNSVIQKTLSLILGLTLVIFSAHVRAQEEAAQPPEGQAAENTAPAAMPRVSTESCSQAFAQANQCCNDPMSCVVKGVSGQDIATAMTVLGSVAMMTNKPKTADEAAQMKKSCEIMQLVGAAAAAFNGGGATLCYEKKSACDRACKKVIGQIREQDKANQEYCSALDPEIASSVPGCGGESTDLEGLNYAQSRLNNCESLNNNIAAMGQQAVQSGTASSLASLCAQIAATTPTSTVADIDCSLDANKTLSYCLPDCSDPANATSILCKKPEVVDGSKVGDTSSLGSNGLPSGGGGFNFGDGTGAGQDGANQGPQFGPTSPTNSKASGIPNGGGGFAGGASGGAGGGGAGGGPGGGKGYNTDVLGAPSGGSGYSGDPGGGYVSSNGGFSGYGERGRPASTFDLRQFLPGGKKDPTRQVAGVGQARPEIGLAHEDIFDRLSKRVKEICKTDRLYDCAK